eukprot:531875_1
MSHKFISNKPRIWILLYSIIVDIIIHLGFIWWGIKLIFRRVFNDKYCSNYTYVTLDTCDEYTYCDWIYSWVYYWITYILGFCCCWICCRNCSIRRHRSDYITLKHEGVLENNMYENRQYWIKHEALCCTYNLVPGFFEYIVIYVFQFLLAAPIGWIAFIYYRDMNSDYVIKWYEVCTIWLLFISKMMLQISYTFGPQYKPNSEIEWILVDLFGEDITLLIKEYMPRFNIIKEIELNTIDTINDHQ